MNQTPEKPSLLIVDDDPLIAETLSLALAADFDVVLSTGRAHCLDLLRRRARQPDIALVDLGLPPFPHRPDEGFTLISELATQFPRLKVVVLTGQSEADNARHARTLGAVDFVAKPSPPSSLLPVLRRALEYGSLDATLRNDLQAALVRATALAEQAAMPGADALARRAASALYHVTSAISMA